MIQVLLVAGGTHFPGGTNTYLDSTEIFGTPGRSWRTLNTARLPSRTFGLKAGTANNIVFIFGNNCIIFHNILYFIFISNQEDMTKINPMLSTPSSPSTRQRNPGSQLDKWLCRDIATQLRSLKMSPSTVLDNLHKRKHLCFNL